MDDGSPIETEPYAARTTQGAEGLPRRFFSTADVREMMKAGIFHREERFELVGGELVPMNAKNNRHEVWKRKLAMRWSATLFGGPFDLAVETSVYLGEGYIFEPDIVVYYGAIQPEDVRGPDCLILVEIADSSLTYDLGAKAPVYAAHGVQEYWVLNTQRRLAHRFAKPNSDGTWGYNDELGENETLTPRFQADLSVKLTDLDL